MSRPALTAIADVFRDVAIEAADAIGAGFLVSAQHLAQVLGVQPLGELGRAHEVAEHHCELPPFGCAFTRRLQLSCPILRRGGALCEGSNRREKDSPVTEGDAELPQVLIIDMGQRPEVDVTVSKFLGILTESETLEPLSNITTHDHPHDDGATAL